MSVAEAIMITHILVIFLGMGTVIVSDGVERGGPFKVGTVLIGIGFIGFLVGMIWAVWAEVVW